MEKQALGWTNMTFSSDKSQAKNHLFFAAIPVAGLSESPSGLASFLPP
jgi:hypothetical protein